MNHTGANVTKNEEAIFSHLSRLLERTDVASNSFKLSSVAIKCSEQVSNVLCLDEIFNYSW